MSRKTKTSSIFERANEKKNMKKIRKENLCDFFSTHSHRHCLFVAIRRRKYVIFFIFICMTMERVFKTYILCAKNSIFFGAKSFLIQLSIQHLMMIKKISTSSCYFPSVDKETKKKKKL